MIQSGPERGPVSELTTQQAADLAERHGLSQMGVRPPFWRYLKKTWQRRRFLWTLSSAQSYSRNQDNYLGQLWSILNPLLLAGAYFLIFGVLLGIDEGTTNYVGFLVIGLFLFIYTASNLTSAAKAISGNLGLVRSLQFPRCLLPLSVALTEFIAVLPSLGVLVVLMLVTGETPSVAWLLFPVAIFLHVLINVGLALITARVVHSSRDLRNLVPLIVRLLRYVSGVFFSISAYAGDGLVGIVMQYQPVAVTLEIARQALMEEFTPDLTTWLVAVGWAVVLPVVGIVSFWQAEATYGRN